MCGAFGTFAHQAYTACLRGQLSSNVRPHIHTTTRAQALRMRRSASTTQPCFGKAMNSDSLAKLSAAVGKHVNRIRPSYSSPLANAQPPVEVGTRALTPQALGQRVAHSIVVTLRKAQCALPNSQSGEAAAAYGSRNRLLLASATSTASPWSSSRLQRGTGDARRVLGTSQTAGLPQVRPNPSLKLTRYGRLCKPGLRQSYYRRSPGLQSLPPRAA